MKILRTIWEWTVKNFSNIFSVLGFVLTIYFGVFYVPSWLKESQDERLRNAQNEIQQSVKELVFSDSSFTIDQLNSLVHAKEISLNEKFPLSLSDILTKAEESFMEDRYLPLIKRQELIKEIETIKEKLPKESSSDGDNKKAGDNKILWSGWLSILASILAVIIGIISAFIRFQLNKDKEEEIKNEIQEVTVPKEIRKYGYQIENEFAEVLRSQKNIQLKDKTKDDGIDFEFTHKDKQYYIEVKYLSSSKIGLNTLHQLIYYLNGKSGEAILVYNTDLTALVKSGIEKFNRENKNIKITAARVTNAKEFEELLSKILR